LLLTIVNFSQKYASSLQTKSFEDMWSKIHPIIALHQLRLEQVLDPDPKRVKTLEDEIK
jgi:hypothetical protein